MKPKNTL